MCPGGSEEQQGQFRGHRQVMLPAKASQERPVEPAGWGAVGQGGQEGTGVKGICESVSAQACLAHADPLLALPVQTGCFSSVNSWAPRLPQELGGNRTRLGSHPAPLFTSLTLSDPQSPHL